ncbi:Nucleic acid-binding, OB-fold, partial [Cynara cardunculus var. scolymus]
MLLCLSKKDDYRMTIHSPRQRFMLSITLGFIIDRSSPSPAPTAREYCQRSIERTLSSPNGQSMLGRSVLATDSVQEFHFNLYMYVLIVWILFHTIHAIQASITDSGDSSFHYMIQVIQSSIGIENPPQDSYLGNEWKKPFVDSSHAKGIVLEKIRNSLFNWNLTSCSYVVCSGIKAKQPNYAIIKCARVQLIKNGKKIVAFVPND